MHALRGWPTPFGVTVNSAEQFPDAQGRFDERVDGALAILAGQVDAFVWRLAAGLATGASSLRRRCSMIRQRFST